MAGGHPNVYLYCANDPLNAKDPSGLSQEDGGSFWYNFFRELLKGETWTHGITSGLAATGSSFSFGGWDGGAYKNEVGFGTSYLFAGISRDCLITAGTLGMGEAVITVKSAGTVGRFNSSSLTRQVGPIQGYTRHGINQAISRSGGGVKTRAILDAVKKPIKVQKLSNGRVKYIGKDAVVVLNRKGEVITTWPKSSQAVRCVSE